MGSTYSTSGGEEKHEAKTNCARAFETIGQRPIHQMARAKIGKPGLPYTP